MRWCCTLDYPARSIQFPGLPAEQIEEAARRVNPAKVGSARMA